MTTEYTPNFRFNLPDFRMGPWHDLVNDDFIMIDQLLWSIYGGIDAIPWANSTEFALGEVAIDLTDGSQWVCATAHTSAVTGTFAADRAAHPGYWSRANQAKDISYDDSLHTIGADNVQDALDWTISGVLTHTGQIATNTSNIAANTSAISTHTSQIAALTTGLSGKPSLGAIGSQTVGLTAVTGSATTAMRSDAAPPIDQAIAPTWTSTHKFQHATLPVQFQLDNFNRHDFKFAGTPGNYQASYLLDATGLTIGHNSSGRTFELQTNNTTRIRMGGAGNVDFDTQAYSDLQTLTDGATISTWDARLGQKAKVTLGAAGRTMPALSNAIEGATYFLWVIQDGTGSRTITTWASSGSGSFDFGAAGAPTLTTTASRGDLLTFESITIGGTLKLRYTGIAKGFA